MWLNKVINKIRNTDKIDELIRELKAKDRDITCYQRAIEILKGEVKKLTAERSCEPGCALGSWCDDCKHLKHATMPNEQYMIHNAHDCFVDAYAISRELYHIKYCGKHTHEFCKEWELK